MGRPSPALIVACAALAVAIGGTGYAVTSLPRNSVGTRQLKANAVTSAKVKDGSLLAADFKAGQLAAAGAGSAGQPGPAGPTGATGAPGPAGPAGPAGSVRAYGRVLANGTLSADDSSGIASVTHPATGVYCVTPAAGIQPDTSPPVVTLDYFQSDTLAQSLAVNGYMGHIEASQPNLASICPSTAYSVSTFSLHGSGPTLSFSSEGFMILIP